jgi:hypothetical protein
MRSACLIAAVSCLLLCCGPFKRIHRAQPPNSTAQEAASRSDTVAGHNVVWNAADARHLAREMMTDCLSGPWIRAYLGVTGNKPVVTVGPVHDWTAEGIDSEPVVKSCEQELSKSEQVSFVVCPSRSEEAGHEGAGKQEFVSPETIKRIKSETGATFILVGAVRWISDKTAGGSPPYYQIELEMINTKTLAGVWSGSGKIGQ